jgi:serine protease AprX
VVSGEIALLLQQYPQLTPGQVKWLVTQSATGVAKSTTKMSGSGLIDVKKAQKLPGLKTVLNALTPTAWGKGTGSLEASRGSSHVSDGTTELTGEVDVFGAAWNGAAWAKSTQDQKAWTDGKWRNQTMTGAKWSGTTWPTTRWTGSDWTGVSYASEQWSARTWRDESWAARTWRDESWSARTWRSEGWN